MKDIRKVLIIGGNGFIGTNLAGRLSKREDLDVYSFDLTMPQKKVGKVSYLTGDFFDGEKANYKLSKKRKTLQ